MRQLLSRVSLPILTLLSTAGSALAAGGGAVLTADPSQHFDPKGKLPSATTIELQQRQRRTLPFADQRDLQEAKRGFIAAPPYRQIMAEAGHVAWDMGSYDWLLQGKEFNSIHPSLQRQAVLNMAYGVGYRQAPGKRGPGFGISFLCSIALLVMAIVGVVSQG